MGTGAPGALAIRAAKSTADAPKSAGWFAVRCGYSCVVGPPRDMRAFAAFPGIGDRGGFSEFFRVYWFGKRMASIVGARGSDALILRIIA